LAVRALDFKIRGSARRALQAKSSMGIVVNGTALFYGLGLLAMAVTYVMPSNKDKG
jgi:hypothetical protein